MLGRRNAKGRRIAIRRWKRYQTLWDSIALPDSNIPFGFFVKNNVTCSCSFCKAGGYKSKGKNKRTWKEEQAH